MVRVGSLFDIASMNPDHTDNKSGMSPEEQLDSIYRVIPGLVERKRRIYRAVCMELEKEGIKDVQYEELTPLEREYAEKFFDTEMLPILSPQIIDSRHPKPHFQSKGLYVASLVHDKNDRKSMAFVRCRSTFRRS